jgi:hypothetical protein
MVTRFARKCLRQALGVLGDEGALPVRALLASKPGGEYGQRSSRGGTWSILANESVARASQKMLEGRVGSLMVTTSLDSVNPVGMLTERE